MIDRQPVRDFYQRIIGWIDTDTVTGDQTGRDFYQRIVGTYVKRFNQTRDFYGRVLYKGNMLAALIQQEDEKLRNGNKK